jgi:ketosteroid isomerase-like protein
VTYPKPDYGRLKVNRIKFAIAIFFVASIVLSLYGNASAFPPFVAKAKKFGAKDCTFCHVDPLGGPPWNERGKWLVEEKTKRNADAIDVEWLVDYKESGKKDSAAKAADSKPADSANSSGAGSAETDVLNTERQWLEAYMKSDFAALERIKADDYNITYSTGEVMNKAQEIAKLKSMPAGAFKLNTEDTKVRLYGDTAVLTGVIIQSWADSGKPMNARLRYTDVWVKRSGRWQVVAAQLTNIPEAAAAKPQEAQAKKVDPKVYDAYVGEYETPMFIIAMTKEGDRLFGEPKGDSKEELVPETESRFKVANVNATVTFIKDGTGKVTGIEIELNGQKIEGKRIK